jgi:protein SCO1/2
VLVAAVAVIVAALLVSRSGLFDKAPPPSAIGGAFTLVDQDGRTVDQTVLNGKWSVVFFGFTYCPDVCPTTLQALNGATDLLGADAKKLRIVFISVDPERDTPAVMKAYAEVNRLPPGSLALTGSKAQTDAVAKAYRVYYAKSGEGADYTINHTSAAYLMDPKGRFVAPLGYGMTPEQLAGQIRAAMRG